VVGIFDFVVNCVGFEGSIRDFGYRGMNIREKIKSL